MDLREETFTILKESFGPESAYKVLEYIDSRIRDDVATQKDVYELKLEIEKLRADLSKDIEKLRADLSKDIEKLRADLSKDIEKVRGDTEKMRGDLTRDIEKVRVDVLKWSFAFWISQMALLGGILFKLLS
jgi:hypothetical protein